MENSDELVEKKEKGSCVPAKYSNIIIEEGEIHLEKGQTPPALIVGFLGPGLVGNIIANELVEQLKLKQIGFVTTEDLPAMSIFIDGVLRHPFRIYFSKKHKLIVALCEVPFNKSSRYLDLARAITDWALKIGVEEICCIQGIPVQGSPMETPVYVAAEREVIDRILKTGGIEVLPRGLVLGPEAELLNVCMINKLKGYALLTPVNPQIPSPDGAAAIIEALNKIYSLNVDTKKLLSEAQKIKDKLMELNIKTQEQHKKIPEISSSSDSADNLYL